MRLEDEHEMAIQWYVDICIDTRQGDTKQKSAKNSSNSLTELSRHK